MLPKFWQNPPYLRINIHILTYIFVRNKINTSNKCVSIARKIRPNKFVQCLIDAQYYTQFSLVQITNSTKFLTN